MYSNSAVDHCHPRYETYETRSGLAQLADRSVPLQVRCYSRLGRPAIECNVLLEFCRDLPICRVPSKSPKLAA
jgi:hypothetical protein